MQRFTQFPDMLGISIPTLRGRDALRILAYPLSEKLSGMAVILAAAERAIAHARTTGISGGPAAVPHSTGKFPTWKRPKTRRYQHQFSDRRGSSIRLVKAVGWRQGGRVWLSLMIFEAQLIEPPLIADEGDRTRLGMRRNSRGTGNFARLMELPSALIPSSNGFELYEYDAQGEPIPFDSSAYRERCRPDEWNSEKQAMFSMPALQKRHRRHDLPHSI